jgi:hypothetical protein
LETRHEERESPKNDAMIPSRISDPFRKVPFRQLGALFLFPESSKSQVEFHTVFDLDLLSSDNFCGRIPNTDNIAQLINMPPCTRMTRFSRGRTKGRRKKYT